MHDKRSSYQAFKNLQHTLDFMTNKQALQLSQGDKFFKPYT